MIQAGGADSLTVINGPEDGSRYDLCRGPVLLGAEASCPICLRLDNTVRPIHARLVADADGYRVRSASGGPVWVDGRRTGSFRSRVLRSGEVLRVGHSELILECAPDGAAHRSRGVVSESDAAWLLRGIARISGATLKRLAFMGGTCVGFVVKRWKLSAVIALAAACWYSPAFRHSVVATALRAAQHLQAIVQNVLA